MARPPGFKRHAPHTTKNGPFCGAKRRGIGKGKLCRLGAGYKTDHPGQGRCKFHGGCSPIRTTGRYSKVMHNSIKEKMEELSKIEINVLDLEPELLMLRALTVDFINRYEEFVDALMEWYTDHESNTKPRRILDLADAGRLLETISRMVERIHKMRQEGAISLDTFRRVTEQMGVIVVKHIKDPKSLQSIEAEWGMLAIDAKRIDHHAESEDVDVEEELDTEEEDD